MDTRTYDFESAALADAEHIATSEQQEMLAADKVAWRRALERLLDDTEDQLDEVRRLQGPERDQVVADFERLLDRLEDAYDRLVPPPPRPEPRTVPATATASVPAGDSGGATCDPRGEVRLQLSWSAGRLVAWAGGPATSPADQSGLADALKKAGAPTDGWEGHADVHLPDGGRAASSAIRLGSALGWLVSLGAAPEELDGEVGIGAGARWLGRVARTGVRLVSQGAVVPELRTVKRRAGETRDVRVRWAPALVDDREANGLAASMPATVTAVAAGEAKTVVNAVLSSVVDAIVTTAAQRVELPAPPPAPTTVSAVAEAVVTRLDGSAFEAPARAAAEVSTRLDRWTQSVTGTERPRLVVQLDPPDMGDAWLLSVLGPGSDGELMPIERALADRKNTRAMGDELVRLERAFPALLRPGGQRRGQVYLSQDEAWELMTRTGSALEAAGFDIRVPALSRRKPSAALRLFTSPTGDTVVGAHQLAHVSWSVVFDDVELTADEVARLSAQARPLVRSRGRWVELDKADLREAAAALAERSQKKQLTGAEILRHAMGLEGTGIAGGLTVEGEGWAADLLTKVRGVEAEAVTKPEGFVGELRVYQADALGWLSFLDSVGLGGCLALDMGLGKTATVLAHIGRTAGNGPSLVIAPPAVVGNWASEAARFTPGLRVLVHHGASRQGAEELATQARSADLVITTYGTAVRDVEALGEIRWDRVVIDEAQAIKNPASDTAQKLRLIPARSRVALTGTPVENGLGDLWSILDFANPGLLGPRAAFIAQLSGDRQAALKALNGILVFRRTKREPAVAAELPDRIDELDRCTMTAEQIGLYQAVLDRLVADAESGDKAGKQGAVLAAITALKQICNHPAAYNDDGRPLAGRSGKLARLEEIVDAVFASGERILVFTHFAEWGKRLADHLTEVSGIPISCYHGGLARGPRDALVAEFQQGEGPGALVLSLKAGGTGLNLTAASHVVLYDRWWNPAVEDQARDRAWRIGQTRTVVSHRLVCPGTVDERVEEVVAGKRHVADLVLPKSSSLGDLDPEQLRLALGLRTDTLLLEEAS
jgi:hypothetical protein